MSGQNPRQIAAQVLQQRRAPGGDFTENLLDRAFQSCASPAANRGKSGTQTPAALAGEGELSAADRGLCRELVAGVVRWQATLDWLIARKTEGRKQKPLLQELLRLGLYQIFWLDRIPPHAAVNETVELARLNGFGARAGFVNALLRAYLREAEPTRRRLAELRISDPAAGFSHPRWLVEKWRKLFGDDRARQLLEWNNQPPRTFARVNRLKFDSPSGSQRAPAHQSSHDVRDVLPPGPAEILGHTGDLLARWRQENVQYDLVRRDWLEENLVFELTSHPPLASLPSFQDGGFYLQDPGTLLAPALLGAQPGESILDFCAAPGGKTTYLAQMMRNRGRIVAQDVSKERLKLIEENCRRLGVTCVELVLHSTPGRPASTFDRILVDAPCSNTGVMRRRLDLRWRIRPDEISRLQRTQLQLLRQAAAALKPGGVIVYSTCSLEPEENSEVVKSFLAEPGGFELGQERTLLPFSDGVDGAYVARLTRS
ncbi:MAG: 16S rRNA (cytosine(967)-C(5))-methyltransferase RsmB [Verrucomicrobiota bacterium]